MTDPYETHATHVRGLEQENAALRAQIQQWAQSWDVVKQGVESIGKPRSEHAIPVSLLQIMEALDPRKTYGDLESRECPPA